MNTIFANILIGIFCFTCGGGAVHASDIAVHKGDALYTVPVTINGEITLNFLIDSGASDVIIPADVVSTLVRAGSVTKHDIFGKEQFKLATGTLISQNQIEINTLTIGNVTINNVIATISPTSGDLVLGGTFLTRFQYWGINTSNNILVLGQINNNQHVWVHFASTQTTNIFLIQHSERVIVGKNKVQLLAAIFRIVVISTGQHKNIFAVTVPSACLKKQGKLSFFSTGKPKLLYTFSVGTDDSTATKMFDYMCAHRGGHTLK
jgi:hypothetical protein